MKVKYLILENHEHIITLYNDLKNQLKAMNSRLNGVIDFYRTENNRFLKETAGLNHSV